VGVESASGATFEATSPSTGEVIARVPQGAREDAQRAIAAANDAWRDWASRSAFERAGAMRRMAEIVRERRDDLARTVSLDQGKPLRAEASDEVEELIAYFEMASGLAGLT
jgi:acyl-CoA reductase-like NAD-dependent aldehyde dehydrogenase